MKSIRKAVMRKFKNACIILHKGGMVPADRHNIFCDCVTRAKSKRLSSTDKEKKQMNLLAQEYFIEKVTEEYPEWFEGVKL